MDPVARGLDAPAQQVTIALVHIAKGSAGQGVALDIVDAPLFDLAFVRRSPGTTRRDEEAVVLGALAVAALHLGIVAGGADDRGAQIVQHDTARDAAEELERGAVQASPGLDA